MHAQPANRWVRYYDGQGETDVFYDVFATAQGGYAMAGESHVNRNRDGFWLLVTDINGEELFQRTYTDEQFPRIGNRSFSLIQTDESGFLLGGTVKGDDGRSNFSVLRVDEDGERIWWRTYGEAGGAAECWAVIELKSGEYVAAGRLGRYDSYAVMINGEGDVLWERVFEGRWFRAVRETQEGLLFAGTDNDLQGWLLKTDFDGEVVWSNTYGNGGLISLVSCIEEGFAAGGSSVVEGQSDWRLLRVNNEGQQLWTRLFDFGVVDLLACLTRLMDGGFAIVGRPDPAHNSPASLRTDSAGNEQWRRVDNNRIDGRGFDEYYSTVVGPDNMIMVAGAAYAGDERGVDGLLIKIIPIRSPPTIWEYTPEELEFHVLTGDSVNFAILRAEDLQNDSLYYTWIFDEDTVSTDTSTTIIFDESDEHNIECFVSDGELADSIQWVAHVQDFFIDSFEPDNLEMIIRRGSEIEFAVNVAALEEIEYESTWTLTHRNNRQEEIGNEDLVSVVFDQTGDHALQVLVMNENESDEVNWTITVRSAIWSWWPAGLELSAYVDSTYEFVITPFNVDSDSLDYVWLLNNEQVGRDSATVFITFHDTEQNELTSIVHDGIEVDTIRWTVNVEEWSFTTDETDLMDFPSTPVLYPASPNPLNSSVNLSFYLPVKENVGMSIYDLTGKEVFKVYSHKLMQGKHDFTWNASSFPAAVYIVNFLCGEVNSQQKLVLVK